MVTTTTTTNTNTNTTTTTMKLEYAGGNLGWRHSVTFEILSQLG